MTGSHPGTAPVDIPARLVQEPAVSRPTVARLTNSVAQGLEHFREMGEQPVTRTVGLFNTPTEPLTTATVASATGDMLRSR